ncbi:hypothetical protein [Taklimakanibacter lacteus]|uniref:hypothetical protein n=1 Tax=Taklimakanibacter lacteus TaxID=2268456 RepID=UPI000E65F4A4
MVTKNDRMAEILDRYIDEVNPEPVSFDEVADWVLSKGLYAPEPRDVRRMCKEALAAGARAQKRFDGKRWYRAKHSVTTNIGGVQLSIWADIDKNASRTFMEKSLSQRRRGIVNDCYQMKMDIDHFNETRLEEPLPLFLDFTDDVLELEAAKRSEDDAA